MWYVIKRTERGHWAVNAYNDAGQLGAQVLCSSTSMAMKVFLMLAGAIALEDERHEILNEDTQPSIKAVV